MEGGNLDDALELLEKSLKMNKDVLHEEDLSNLSIYITMSHIYLRKNMFDEAIKQLSLVKDLAEAKSGVNSETTASILLELADAYLKKEDYKEAIEYQRKAFEVYQESESIDKKTLVSILIKLSEIYEQAEMVNEAIETLRGVIYCC